MSGPAAFDTASSAFSSLRSACCQLPSTSLRFSGSCERYPLDVPRGILLDRLPDLVAVAVELVRVGGKPLDRVLDAAAERTDLLERRQVALRVRRDALGHRRGLSLLERPRAVLEPLRLLEVLRPQHLPALARRDDVEVVLGRFEGRDPEERVHGLDRPAQGHRGEALVELFAQRLQTVGQGRAILVCQAIPTIEDRLGRLDGVAERSGSSRSGSGFCGLTASQTPKSRSGTDARSSQRQ